LTRLDSYFLIEHNGVWVTPAQLRRTLIDATPYGEPVPDLYEMLAVSPEASGEDIARAYRRRARELHPDSREDDTADPALFHALADAYRVLSDPARRAEHDRARRAGYGRPCRAGCGQARNSARGRGPRLAASPPPPLWPLDPAGPLGPPGRRAAPGAPLSAGPVRVGPPAAPGAPLPAGPVRVGPPAAPGWHAGARESALASLLRQLLDNGERRW
jgi:hypothetical protein